MVRLLSSEVTVPAPSFDLTTLAAVKLEFDIRDDTTDVYLQSQITRVSGQISAYCRRVFAHQTYLDQFAGHFHRLGYIYLPNRPVVPGSLDAIGDGVGLVEGTDFDLMPATGMISHWSRWVSELQVSYEAGYWLPGWDEPSGSGDLVPRLPAAIEAAAVEMVAAARQSGRMQYSDRDPSVRSETVEGAGTLTYSSTSTTFSGRASGGMPDSVLSKLEYYRIPVRG